MIPRKEHEIPDSGPDQLRTPTNLGGFRVVRLLVSEEKERKELHKALDEILDGGDEGLKIALSLHITHLLKLTTRKAPTEPRHEARK